MGCPTKFRSLGKKCFLCNGKKDLSMAIQYGYEDLFYHYHPECVRRVLRNPEQYPNHVDNAIAIMDRINEQLEKLRLKGENRLRGLERAWGILKILDTDR